MNTRNKRAGVNSTSENYPGACAAYQVVTRHNVGLIPLDAAIPIDDGDTIQPYEVSPLYDNAFVWGRRQKHNGPIAITKLGGVAHLGNLMVPGILEARAPAAVIGFRYVEDGTISRAQEVQMALINFGYGVPTEHTGLDPSWYLVGHQPANSPASRMANFRLEWIMGAPI